MPEYLAPGVFVEEVSFRSKSIEGVGTSVVGMVGPTRTGPLRGKPELVTSYADFVRIYGEAEDLVLGGSQVLNHSAIAAKAFFDNGGKQLFMTRISAGVNGTDEHSTGSTAIASRVADASNHVTFSSRFPGAAGNYTLELRWRDSENLLKTENTTSPANGEVLFVNMTITAASHLTGSGTGITFPVSIKGLVTFDGSGSPKKFTIDKDKCEVKHDLENSGGTVLTAADVNTKIKAIKQANIPVDATILRVKAKQPTSSPLTDGTSAVLTLSSTTDSSLSTYTSGDWGSLTTIYGTLDNTGKTFTVDGSGLNSGVASGYSFNLAALGAVSDILTAVMVQRNFDIDVRNGGASGEIIYSYDDISTAHTGENSLPEVLAPHPEKLMDRLTSPIACSFDVAVTSGTLVVAALNKMFDKDALSPSDPLDIAGPRYLITLGEPAAGITDYTGVDGTDGDVPGASDFAGETDEVKGSTGLAAMEDLEDISIVMSPAAAAHTTTHQAVVAEVQKHCNKMRYRVGIVDSQEGMALSEIRDFRSQFDDSRLALYYPWIVASDPSGNRNTITVPPSGFVAGVYANTDVTRGVHKPPANETVLGALSFAQEINRFQQELLNPNGINCLRSFPGRGHRVWGGRTLASDPEWKYINVRRYFLYLERSIDKSTQWVVFEPNGELLWENVRSSIEDFLYNEWFNGRLLGGSPKESYFVRCDRSTMTQNDIDNGRLVCLIGVAALKPAEFVIFRIGQKTAGAQS